MGEENGGKRAEAAVNRLLWWILGIAALLLGSGGAFWLNHVEGQITDLHQRDRTRDEQMSGARERLGRVEETLRHVERSTNDTRNDVREIRRLLEGRESGPTERR